MKAWNLIYKLDLDKDDALGMMKTIDINIDLEKR